MTIDNITVEELGPVHFPSRSTPDLEDIMILVRVSVSN